MNIEEKNIDETTDNLSSFSDNDLNEFILANGYAEQWKILLMHAEKNHKIVKIKRRKEEEKTYQEISDRFNNFLHTKGLIAKFKVAFSDMSESAKRQHEQDVANFNEVKKKSKENNPEFDEFIHTRGFKAKVKLVIENMKKSAKNASQKTAEKIDRLNAKTKQNIARTRLYTQSVLDINDYSLKLLTEEFNEFLKESGLADKYIVEVIEKK